MSVALVVLAGGRSERLGGLIKPLLVRPDGRTLIEGVIDALAPLADETIIVAPALIAPLFAGRAIVVEDPGRGPALALAAAASNTSCLRILLTAADHVSPNRALGEKLLSIAEDRSAVVSLDGMLQPAFATYSTRALLGIDPFPESLRDVLARIDPFVFDASDIEPDMLSAFDDVDTPDDVARYRLSAEGVPTWSHLAAGRW